MSYNNRYSDDSARRPLSTAHYHSAGTGMHGEEPNKKRGLSNWVKFGVPIGIVVIIAAVVGGVVGSRANKDDKASSAGSTGGGNTGGGTAKPPTESELSSIKSNVGRFATATNSFGIPLYPSTTNAAAFGSPTFLSSTSSSSGSLSWPKDPHSFSSPSATTVRPDRPRIIAPAYKWDALQNLIDHDPYMKAWNDAILAAADSYSSLPPVPYTIDGGLDKSGVLDVAREIKQRIKAFAYAYRVTKQTSYADRAWRELLNASGTGGSFGTAPDNWNSAHFLDVAEFTAAFAIGYDWLYEFWTNEQKTTIRNAIINLGLKFGVDAYNGAGYGWWRTVNGNWNCVCNGGLTLGALAILGDDTSGIAQQILGLTIPNAEVNCGQGPSTDGSWSETAHYWYFGTTTHAEMASALLTATGSTYGLLNRNPNFQKTGLYHMYVTGHQQLFDYGDHGPNKFSTTANSMLFYGSEYNTPEYTLFQRDRADVAEPWSMFWYDPAVTGAWWNGLALDHHFDDPSDNWASMRSSWTDNTGLYVAVKAGNHTGHQAHGDLDAGTFVLDAMGVRWAGELGSGDYIAPGYFTSEAQDSQRWLYYRKRTEGQNVVIVGRRNQLVSANPPVTYGSSGTTQGSSTVLDVPADSSAFFTTDLTSTYQGVTTYKRGIRLLNGRKQVLLQDEVVSPTDGVQWRMHTNATITASGASATLTLDGKTMQVSILNPPTGAAFERLDPVRYTDDPALPTGATDQANPGVSVLAITLPSGTYNLQVLFNPQWPGMSSSDFKTPPSVTLDGWSLTSHN